MWLVLAALTAAAILTLAAGQVDAACSKEEFAAAVDKAGAGLRAFNAATNPKLKEKLRLLKAKKGWTDAGYEEKGLDYIQDDRIDAFDMEANNLLSKVDEFGRTGESAPPDCARLAELQGAGDRLLSVMKAKSAYTLDKLDAELGIGPAATVAAKPVVPPRPPATPRDKGGVTENWSTTTAPTPLPPDAFTTSEQGYTIDEIREVTRGFFGTISTELAAVIEHAFAKSGRPSAYVLGTEGGGAFLAGLRYGKGTLYLRSGGTQKVYWHGPSIGGDIGAEGARTLYLIYNLERPEALFRSYAGVDGSAYLVGGFGIRFLKGGDVIMAPIRSGIGLRLGASIGYVRFTPTPTWNPF